MGKKFTTQRATQIAAGGIPVAVGCHRAIELAHGFLADKNTVRGLLQVFGLAPNNIRYFHPARTACGEIDKETIILQGDFESSIAKHLLGCFGIINYY